MNLKYTVMEGPVNYGEGLLLNKNWTFFYSIICFPKLLNFGIAGNKRM